MEEARPVTFPHGVQVASGPKCRIHVYTQVNKKFRKFERKYRDCIKRNGDKIGTQTCYEISM